MKNINDYKEKFYNLMESTIGDVRPLISEQNKSCSVAWMTLVKDFKPGYKLGDLPFIEFIENIPGQGATFGTKSRFTVDLEPNGVWSKWDAKGNGMGSGKWSCIVPPGSKSAIINLD